jgi:hypothetical protein
LDKRVLGLSTHKINPPRLSCVFYLHANTHFGQV